MSVPRVMSKPSQLGDKVLDVPQPTEHVKKLFQTTGVKSANSQVHNVLRVLVVLFVIVIIIKNIIDDNEETVYIQELEPYIKKGSLLHRTIDELDEEPKQKYLLFLKKKLVDNKRLTKVEKYLSNLKVSLIAAVLSEYAINGNTSKPLSVIAKTIFYSVVYTTITL